MKILLAGDSTMADKPVIEPYDFARCYCGWGQAFSRFVVKDAGVRNFAVNGYTSEAFRSACTPSGYEQLLEAAEPGDYVLLQFGHNDQKRPHLRAYGGFANELRRYIDELRAATLRPVMVTQLCRNSWRCDDGSYHDLLHEYAQAAIDVAEEKDVPLIDLHCSSLELLRSIGREKAKRYFYPGDFTHTNGAGGIMAATLVAEGILHGTHPDLQVLKQAIRPAEQWPAWRVEDSQVDPVTGWAAEPPVHTQFDFLADDAPVTVLQALRMAREGYAWFVYRHTDTTGAAFEYWCAQENGYFPAELAPGYDPDAPCTGDLLARLMTASCAGRAIVSEQAYALQPVSQPDGTVTGRDARNYALRLEQLTFGASEKKEEPDAPAGS